MAAVVSLSAACSLLEDESSGNAGAVEARVLFSTEVGSDGVPVNPRNLFAPNAREIRATVLLEGVEVGMKVTTNWYQLGTGAAAGKEGQLINGSDVVLDAKSVVGGNRASITSSQRASNFPEDVWLLRVFIDGHLVKTAGFVVNRSAGASAAPSAPAPTPTPVAYTVVSGDTIASVAQRFLPQGQSASDFAARLAQFNSIAPTATLTPGQVLRIPPNQ
jgi:hypothetical protein